MWEAKIVVAVDAVAAVDVSADANWKHLVTPDRGDLMTDCLIRSSVMQKNPSH